MAGSHSTGSTPRHQRRLIVGSFAALVVLTGVAFVFTGAGYFATEKANAGTAVVGTVTDYDVEESADEARIVVDVEVENPTMRPVELDSANLDGVVNGTTVAGGSTGMAETIPAGETETITLRLIPRQGYQSATVEAAESGSLSVSGIMWARIERFRFEIPIGSGDAGGEES